MNICFLVLLNIILLILLLNKKKILYGGEPSIEEQEKNLIETMKEKEDIKNKFNLANFTFFSLISSFLKFFCSIFFFL